MTAQQQAFAIASEIQQLASTVTSVYQQIKRLQAIDAPINAAQYLKNMPTAAVNPDGSIGTADATPNNADPITANAIYASANSLYQALVYLGDVANTIDGTAAPAIANRLATFSQIGSVTS